MQPYGQGQASGSVPFTEARLCVVSNDQKGRIYPLGTRLTIGRGIHCDIVTADPRASRDHAEIQRRPDGHYVLIDAGSRNGTFVNGQPASQVELHDGDLIQIGDFALITELSSAAAAHQGQFSGTLVGVAPGTATPGSMPDMIDMRTNPVVTIGRDPGNDLTFDHPQISRFHARLQLLPDGSLQVTDLNSTNGSFIDGQQLKGTSTVPSGVTLSFGPFRLVFQQWQLIRATEDGTVRIDALHLTKTVAGDKRLLNDLTFSILPREFVCIVGGSGTGKSTLLDALSGVRPANGGEVRYNSADYYQQMDAFRSAIGYVPQDDIVPTELPVESALYYAAKLRLPPDMSERRSPGAGRGGDGRPRADPAPRCADQESLGRTAQARLDRGRTPLQADPLLPRRADQWPRSGLEGRMMQLLRKLADQGRTVILITHATQNVDMCDNICFLAPGGYLAYYGPPSQALAYFGVEKFADIYTRIESEPSMEIWPQRFQHSPHHYHYITARLAAAGIQLNGAGDASGTYQQAVVKAQSRPPAAKRVPGFRQFRILTQRYLETVLRDRNNLIALLFVQAPLIAVLIALAFRGNIFSTEVFTGDYERGRSITFLLAMVAVWFGTSNSAREIVKETAMYARERRINLKIGPYISSKFFVLIGISLLQNSILLLPFALTGAGFANLPLLYLTLVCGSIAGITMGLSISAVAPNPDRAWILVPLFLIPQIIFGGPIINTRDNALVDVLSRFMITKWTWKSLGSTVGIDNIPAKPVQLAGFNQNEIQQLITNSTNANLIQRGEELFYRPPITPTFEFTPIVYLAILSIFIILSLCLVAFFQRRKDIVR